MLPDGSLLDFGEIKNGGDPRLRSLDHRSIAWVMGGSGGPTDKMFRFIRMGAIRIHADYNQKFLAFNLAKMPTATQFAALAYWFEFVKRVAVDVVRKKGDYHVLANEEWEPPPTMSRLIEWTFHAVER